MLHFASINRTHSPITDVLPHSLTALRMNYTTRILPGATRGGGGRWDFDDACRSSLRFN